MLEPPAGARQTLNKGHLGGDMVLVVLYLATAELSFDLHPVQPAISRPGSEQVETP